MHCCDVSERLRADGEWSTTRPPAGFPVRQLAWHVHAPKYSRSKAAGQKRRTSEEQVRCGHEPLGMLLGG
jgi:hypothetical protein